jgi:hypothetical protein
MEQHMLVILLLEFNLHGSAHRKNILIYVQQDATLHSLFYLESALHVSGVTTTHHQERKQLYLQHLVFVTPLLLPAAIVEEFELFAYLKERVKGICFFFFFVFCMSSSSGIQVTFHIILTSFRYHFRLI